MITCAIHAANKRHFDSLICDYLKMDTKFTCWKKLLRNYIIRFLAF